MNRTLAYLAYLGSHVSEALLHAWYVSRSRASLCKYGTFRVTQDAIRHDPRASSKLPVPGGKKHLFPTGPKCLSDPIAASDLGNLGLRWYRHYLIVAVNSADSALGNALIRGHSVRREYLSRCSSCYKKPHMLSDDLQSPAALVEDTSSWYSQLLSCSSRCSVSGWARLWRRAACKCTSLAARCLQASLSTDLPRPTRQFSCALP